MIAGLSGALVPLAAMPEPAQSVAPAWPGYWAMAALRGAADGDVRTTLVAVAVLTAVSVVTAGVAAYKLSRGWGRATLL